MAQYDDEINVAVISVLAEAGSRGFTHRAVDRQAKLPEGTTSRYARTRDALLRAASDALLAEDRAIALTATGQSPAEFLVAMTGLLLDN
ncbi:TetR/AcrR family transcriptional regulator, partial [Streptomyces sp. SID10244]|nr:TetR/AcrR family transcriptional regulator [Streptomyces sp. SID10244]